MQNSKEKTLSQMVADRIIKYILDENLQPGDKLPNENVMCQRLNVGRSSLREVSARMASRRELLPTFSRWHIMVSFGSLSPGCRFSSSMYLIILSATFCERVFSLEFCM